MIASRQRVQCVIISDISFQIYHTDAEPGRHSRNRYFTYAAEIGYPQFIKKTVIKRLKLQIEFLGLELALSVILKHGETSHQHQGICHQSYEKTSMICQFITQNILHHPNVCLAMIS